MEYEKPDSIETAVVEGEVEAEISVTGLHRRIQRVEKFLEPFGYKEGVDYSKVLVEVLPGGKMPERKTPGAIGFDVYTRAIVSPYEMDDKLPYLRKTLFNFRDLPADPKLRRWVEQDSDDPGKLMMNVPPGENVLVGIGIATAMEYPMLYWLAPRSGLSSKYRITLANTPGTVDPDYRGEAAAVLVNDSTKPWAIRHQSRIAQLLFSHVFIPDLVEVTREELPETMRGSGGFGSTGVNG